jgi:hypothetical protein
MNLPRSVILQLAAAGVTWGSEKVQSKFIEQQSHKHNGNIFLNTHQGLTANEVLEIIADNLSEAG